MVALLCFVVAILASPLKSRSRLEAENAALRHQLGQTLSKWYASSVLCVRACCARGGPQRVRRTECHHASETEACPKLPLRSI